MKFKNIIQFFKRTKLIFAWYDFRVGLFYDKRKQYLYLFPLPMIGLKFIFAEQKCPKCSWKGMTSKCLKEPYCWNGGTLAYASGTYYICPNCNEKIGEGDSIRS